jgi:hypothetical protein
VPSSCPFTRWMSIADRASPQNRKGLEPLSAAPSCASRAAHPRGLAATSQRLCLSLTLLLAPGSSFVPYEARVPSWPWRGARCSEREVKARGASVDSGLWGVGWEAQPYRAVLVSNLL